MQDTCASVLELLFQVNLQGIQKHKNIGMQVYLKVKIRIKISAIQVT